MQKRYHTEKTIKLTAEDLKDLDHHLALNSAFSRADIITYFAGVRACTYEEDFIIEPSDHVDNLIHAAGIQSPGLASAPAIAEDVAQMAIEKLAKDMEVTADPSFNPIRKAIPDCKHMNSENAMS
jgi:glycerol-3-phosphate dehydrogenase